MSLSAKIRNASIAAAICALASLGSPVVAQTPFEPAAVVNDEAVTRFELDQRLRARSALAGEEISPALASRVLDNLITERLRMQAAERAGVTVSKDQIDAGVIDFARLRGVDAAQIESRLKRAGAAPQTLRDLVESELAWRSVIRRRYGTRARATEADVARELNLQSGGAESAPPEGESRTTYEVGFLTLEAPPNASVEDVTEAENALNAVRDDINGCEELSSRTSEFGPGSGVRSDLLLNQIPTPLDEAVAALTPGQFSDPVRMVNTVVMVMLCAVENTSESDQRMEQVRRGLTQRNFQRYAEAYMQELTRDAVIEIR